jgi:hypothetical protein
MGAEGSLDPLLSPFKSQFAGDGAEGVASRISTILGLQLVAMHPDKKVYFTTLSPQLGAL